MNFCSLILILLSVDSLINCYSLNVEKDVIFRLYTPETPISFFKLNPIDPKSILDSGFNRKRPSVIFIHGWRSQEKVLLRYKNAFVPSFDVNFIAVDWLKPADTFNYIAVKRRVKPICLRLAELLDTFEMLGLHLKDVTIIGHSIGAHMAGRTAKFLESTNKIGTIIGLDPTSMGFSLRKSEKRLDSTDALYVQVIHTDINRFGIANPIGHADYYPNSGRSQPGCSYAYGVIDKILSWVGECSHIRAHYLYLESLKTDFTAIHCDSFELLQEDICLTNKVTGLMGGLIIANSSKPLGVFYLETNDKPSYAIPDYRLFNRTFIAYTNNRN